ncbi:unnamed protein product, partial [Urochloa humidicola]
WIPPPPLSTAVCTLTPGEVTAEAPRHPGQVVMRRRGTCWGEQWRGCLPLASSVANPGQLYGEPWGAGPCLDTQAPLCGAHACFAALIGDCAGGAGDSAWGVVPSLIFLRFCVFCRDGLYEKDSSTS